MLKYFVVAMLVVLANTGSVTAQDTASRKQPGDTVSIVNQIHSDRLRFQKVDSLTQLQILAGHVALQQDNTKFYCDSAVINKRMNILEAFGHVHINDADSVHTYGDYLVYHIDAKTATLKKNVKLTDGKGILTTDELQYDTKAKTGVYTTGGKIVSGSTTITSKEATYYADLKDVYFKKEVKLRDPKNNVDTDSLLYNTETQIATFITKTFIADSSGAKITTSDGFYDMKQRRATFGKNSVVSDGKGVTVTGETIHTDDSTGITTVRGNAVFIDTVQKVSILANAFDSNKKKGTLLATQHPLMIIQQDKDSIYISSDTMYSARLKDLKDSAFTDLHVDTIKNTTVINASAAANNPNDTSDIRYFHCYHHVRIFSDSLQAVCDSLFYSARDSVFRLLTNPIMWGSGSQVTGDTIYLFTKNNKADRIYAFENGFTINKTGDSMYNQISGKTINGYFKNGEIDYMRSKGSPAQSVYYAKDENQAIVGVNNVSGDVIDMRFENKELKKVVVIRGVAGTMYPFRQTPDDKKKLRNFKWQENRRPKTKFELFEN